MWTHPVKSVSIGALCANSCDYGFQQHMLKSTQSQNTTPLGGNNFIMIIKMDENA